MLRTRALGAISGVLAALAGLAAAEVAAGLIGGDSPVFAVGTWAIDTSPTWLREYAIENFGVNDKQVLVSGVVATVAVIGALAGAAGVTRRAFALGVSIALGLVGLLAVTTVRGARDPQLVRIAPALAAMLVSTGGLAWMLRSIGGLTPAPQPTEAADPAPTGRLQVLDRPGSPAAGTQGSPATEPPGQPAGPRAELPAVMIPGRRPLTMPSEVDRRAFLRATGAVGAVALTGGAIWKLGGGGSYATDNLLALPAAASPAKVVGAADFGIPGLTPYFTANDDFYRIDTALIVPRLNLASWKLRIHGMVDKPITLTFNDLLKAPLIERDVTLMCVSNEVGDYYNGNARWLGVRISDVLASVGIRPGADAVRSTSVDGWTCGTPLSALTDPGRDAMFAIGMNGSPLPFDHGFPVRMVVPGLYGFVSATKWITDLEVTRFDEFEAYWTQRGWAAQAPVKTQSRFEAPRPYGEIAPGRTVLAGMAWAQHRGISKVEVAIDDKVHVAELAPWSNPDTWRQWRVTDWKATRGNHTISVRATDGTGAVQTAQPAQPIPDGASGYHTVLLPVS